VAFVRGLNKAMDAGDLPELGRALAERTRRDADMIARAAGREETATGLCAAWRWRSV
jgi:hypothetical protein